MYQEIDEPIDVVVLFEHSSMRPSRFKWKDQIYKISEITGDWKTDVGAYRIRHFAVVDSSSNFFQISYDERKTCWSISKIWVE